jgi:hypothetical protein
MKRFGFSIASVLLCTIASVAQNSPNEVSGHGTRFFAQETSPATHALVDDRTESHAPSAISFTGSSSAPPELGPMTRSERFRNYLIRVAGPQPFITAAAAAGISQAEDTPKEWGGGAEGYGKRIGDAYAQQFIRGTLEYGLSAALHEDNRYFVSSQTGFFRRTRSAVLSTLLARHDSGNQSFSFSRIGSAAGAAFISRAWQPRSITSAGDGAVSFGISIGSDMGFNVLREFWPGLRHHFRQ